MQDLNNHVGMGSFMENLLTASLTIWHKISDVTDAKEKRRSVVKMSRTSGAGAPSMADLTSAKASCAISFPAQSFVNHAPKRRRIASSVNFRTPVTSPFESDESMHPELTSSCRACLFVATLEPSSMTFRGTTRGMVPPVGRSR